MRRKRRNHSPAFKAKVALAALKEEKTLAQLSAHYDVHVNQIQAWRKQLLEDVTAVFGATDDKKASEADTKELQAKIGQLTMENDFLAKVLGH